MKGKLLKKETGWIVSYTDVFNLQKELPLYHKDIVSDSTQDSTEIDFEIVDEFTHPELFYGVDFWSGVECAKLLSKN